MRTNLVIKTNIRVNGKEYASVDAMPSEIRAAYARALASLGGHASQPNVAFAGTDPNATAASISTITFNGQEYDTLEAMPSDVRALYKDVIGTLTHESAASGASEQAAPRLTASLDGGPSGTSIQPQSVGPRLIAVAAAILVLALLVFGRLVISH